MLVDNCAMQLVKDPAQFDVVLTENMFGDILSDEASMVTGSIGMLSSASLREDSLGMYEPSHGSAPDIAGQNIANPLATILSAAMMLRYSFDMDEEAACIEKAVEKVLADNIRTVDIYKEGMTKVSTSQMGDAVVERLQEANMRSDNVKKGVERAPHRSLFNALGMTEEELERPLIGVVCSYKKLFLVI